MPEGLWGSIAAPYLAGIPLSCLLEVLLQPQPAPLWRRPLAALTIHVGLITLLFAMELLLFWRPWFAMANVIALLFFMVLVSNAKFHALREPFISQDFEYFSDALKHPRLYLPFFGLGRTLLAVTCILGAIIAGMLLESPLAHGLLTVAVGLLIVTAGGCLWLGNRSGLVLDCVPADDLSRLGQLAGLWFYARAERRQRPANLPGNALFQTVVSKRTEHQYPDLVVVQSESFFDPRRCYPGINPLVLERFDRLKASATAHGSLKVPAWGANTVRTEYAFLSGLAAKSLGIHQFNPYRWIARQGIPTLASFLRQRGYRTVCIHPYPGDFYGRDKVYPGMGFDEFIDIQGFEGIVPTGPYVGDVALADKVRDMLAENRQRTDKRPLFVYAITMENHGPLHLEELQAGDVAQLHTSTPPAGCQDLTVYLRHLSNADHMIGVLREALEQSERAGWLCFFGDHLPIMAQVYQTLGVPAGDSEYVLWSNKSANGIAVEPAEMRVENLAGLLIQQAGLGVHSGKSMCHRDTETQRL